MYLSIIWGKLYYLTLELWHQEVFNSIKKRLGRVIIVDEKTIIIKSTLVAKKCMELDFEDGLQYGMDIREWEYHKKTIDDITLFLDVNLY